MTAKRTTSPKSSRTGLTRCSKREKKHVLFRNQRRTSGLMPNYFSFLSGPTKEAAEKVRDESKSNTAGAKARPILDRLRHG